MRLLLLFVALNLVGCSKGPQKEELINVWNKFGHIYLENQDPILNEGDLYSLTRNYYSTKYRNNIKSYMNKALNLNKDAIKKLRLGEQFVILNLRNGYAKSILMAGSVDTLLEDRTVSLYPYFQQLPSLMDLKVVNENEIFGYYDAISNKRKVTFDLEKDEWKINLSPDIQFYTNLLLSIKKTGDISNDDAIRKMMWLEENESIPWNPLE